MDTVDSERAKYEAVWDDERYRVQSDGWPVKERAWELLGCQPGESLIDWGCGAGDCAAWFYAQGLTVIGLDIAKNCLRPMLTLPLVVCPIWEAPKGLAADYAFSTDVLEHVPPEFVDTALDMIARRTRKAAFLQVDTVADTSQAEFNLPEPLHLCVQDALWWEDRLFERWAHVEAYEGAYTRAYFLCRDRK